MCGQCDPADLLLRAGLDPSPNRRRVLALILSAERALMPREILRLVAAQPDAEGRKGAMNKVTLYRILDLLVEHGLVDRHPALDRTFRYCASALPGHPRHYHFYCTVCGGMECLAPEQVRVEVSGLDGAKVDRQEVRLDGICGACRKRGLHS